MKREGGEGGREKKEKTPLAKENTFGGGRTLYPMKKPEDTEILSSLENTQTQEKRGKIGRRRSSGDADS